MNSRLRILSWFTILATCAALALGCSKDAPHSAETSASPAVGASGGAATKDNANAGRHAAVRALEVRASFEARVENGRDIDRVTRDLTALTREKRGFVASLSLGDANGGARMTLRIPPAELGAVRAVLSGAGAAVMHQSETATDVTDAIADIDARVAQANVEEARLVKLLAERTGNLADVLAVEKALAEVRERIERFQAEQRVAHGRVDLATVDVMLHAASALAAPPTVAAQLVAAAHDGVHIVSEASLFVATTALRAGPLLLLLASAALGIALAIRKVARRAGV